MIDDKKLDILLINLKEFITTIEDRNQTKIFFNDLDCFYSIKDLRSSKIEYIISKYEKEYQQDKFSNLITNTKERLDIYIGFYENHHSILTKDNLEAIIREKHNFSEKLSESIRKKLSPINKEIIYQDNSLSLLDNKSSNETLQNLYYHKEKNLDNLKNEQKKLRKELNDSERKTRENINHDLKYLDINFKKIYNEFKKSISLIDKKTYHKLSTNFDIFNIEQCAVFYNLTKELYKDNNVKDTDLAALLNKKPVKKVKIKHIGKFMIILRLYDELALYNNHMHIGKFIVEYLELNPSTYTEKKSTDAKNHYLFYENAIDQLEKFDPRIKSKKIIKKN